MSTKLVSTSISPSFMDNIFAKLRTSSSCKTCGTDEIFCNEILFGLPTLLGEVVPAWVVGCKACWTTGLSSLDNPGGEYEALDFIGSAEVARSSSSGLFLVIQRCSLTNG